MINIKTIFIVLFSLCFGLAFGQNMPNELNPEIEKTLKEIIITATKTKRQLSNATVPVTLIKQKEIQNINASRIQGVLEEFTGLNTVSSALGTGIQLQGLDSDYSLIMIDGIPLIGRLNGVLDLSRLSVGNISRIEVVKGPSSVLFGSNALAGVVNIITKSPKKEKSIQLEAKASSFNTYDFGINSVLSYKKYKGVFSSNYYTTGGYDLASNYQGYNISTEYYGKTVSPHSNYSFFIQNEFDISPDIKFHLNGRYFGELENYKFSDVDSNFVTGKGNIKDWSVNPQLTLQLSPKFKMNFKSAYNEYHTNTDELFEDESTYSNSYYNESFLNFELQNDYKYNKTNEFSLGLGYEKEGIQTSRLSNDEFHKADNKYIFIQYILKYKDNLNLILGTRYEQHQNYSRQFNPKLSFKYNITPKYVLKASIGRGFKKPDFKQLYFNYTNNAIGYTVLGTTYVEEGLASLLNQNVIAINEETGLPYIYDLYYTIIDNGGRIDAESSTGINFGLSIRSLKNTIIDLNIFRNDLQNLIETTPIALKKNGWQAYSYQNLNRAFTQGIELDIKYYINDNVKISFGYQFLEAKDKKIVELLNEGEIFAKDTETGISYRIKKNQYGGLLNRPNHNANLKVFASNVWKGIGANLRVLYKGKYGFADLNNNQILDIDKEYVKGYFLLNATINKSFFDEKFSLKFGVDNILNYTYSTPEFTISSLPGRIFYTSINYKFTKK